MFGQRVVMQRRVGSACVKIICAIRLPLLKVLLHLTVSLTLSQLRHHYIRRDRTLSSAALHHLKANRRVVGRSQLSSDTFETSKRVPCASDEAVGTLTDRAVGWETVRNLYDRNSTACIDIHQGTPRLLSSLQGLSSSISVNPRSHAVAE